MADSSFCIFGADPGTGNLGITALGLSLLAGIARRIGDPLVTFFDEGEGIRTECVQVAGRDLTYRRCGAVPTRRIYRRDSLWQIRAAGRLGGFGNAAIDAMRGADAVLDVTSGDGFTDLYGPRRFRWAVAAKQIALEQRVPLILLPQTIGPFTADRARRTARRLIRAAESVWARDPASAETLRALLGEHFDGRRHHVGVDLAFGLEPRKPARRLAEPVASWLTQARNRPLVGLNVSGLICDGNGTARRRYGLRADYRRAVTCLVRRILSETDADILLVPHVFTVPGYQNDPDACEVIASAVDPRDRTRVAILLDVRDPREAKWVIARTDWFCAARMHAAIAALSSGVPAAAVAYSDKVHGVFETCGLDGHVADLRRIETDDVAARLWRSWTARDAARERLHARLPAVSARIETQMDEILQCARRRESAALSC